MTQAARLFTRSSIDNDQRSHRARSAGLTTRRPAFYDLHLAEEYPLKHIRHLPGLSDFLKQHLDGHLKQQADVAKDLEVLSATRGIRSIIGRALKEVCSESDVFFAMQNLSIGYIPWAQALMLAPASSLKIDESLLRPQAEPVKQAIDGLPLMIQPSSRWSEDTVKQLPPKILKALQPMETKKKQVLPTWEVKILNGVGPLQEIFVMAVEEQDFP
ncbi:hypothetical protein FRB96_001748 [Tulasnella sp. 330]|nr:hypothetical protein FRB96_001748 [Tulasnella sp. 330]KAG8881515.1 hypothetical protein FRB97_009442 [Tulasnella sp. 331]